MASRVKLPSQRTLALMWVHAVALRDCPLLGGHRRRTASFLGELALLLVALLLRGGSILLVGKHTLDLRVRVALIFADEVSTNRLEVGSIGDRRDGTTTEQGNSDDARRGGERSDHGEDIALGRAGEGGGDFQEDSEKVRAQSCADVPQEEPHDGGDAVEGIAQLEEEWVCDREEEESGESEFGRARLPEYC